MSPRGDQRRAQRAPWRLDRRLGHRHHPRWLFFRGDTRALAIWAARTAFGSDEATPTARQSRHTGLDDNLVRARFPPAQNRGSDRWESAPPPEWPSRFAAAGGAVAPDDCGSELAKPSPRDLVSARFIAAAKPKSGQKDPCPQSKRSAFSQKWRSRTTTADGYVGSPAVFSDLTFELPQLANIEPEAAGGNLSLRRNAQNMVIRDGRGGLTSVTDTEADVALPVAYRAW